jgi:hypothetical protein
MSRVGQRCVQSGLSGSQEERDAVLQVALERRNWGFFMAAKNKGANLYSLPVALVEQGAEWMKTVQFFRELARAPVAKPPSKMRGLVPRDR